MQFQSRTLVTIYFYLLIYFNIKEFLTILINTSKSKMDNSNE